MEEIVFSSVLGIVFSLFGWLFSSVLGIVFSSAFGWLKSKLSEEVPLQAGVQSDLAFMSYELKMMQGILAAGNVDKGGVNMLTKDWLRKVRDVCYDVEDLLDDFTRLEEKSRWRRVKVLRMEMQAVSGSQFTSPDANSKPNASADAAALSYVAYDEYVLHGKAAHIDDGIPLKQYKKIKKMLLKYDKLSEENGFLVLPGETDHSKVYQVASEESKKIVRAILKSLRENELHSLSFTPFTESNVVVSSSGKVKFRNVSVLRNLIGHDLRQHQRNNYLSAHKIIEDLFSGHPPQDIMHLLNLIESDFEARELFHIHGSLVSMAVYWTLFKNMHEHIRSVLSEEDRRAILGSLPYIGTWKAQIQDNELLLITFNYNPKSYQIPSDKPRKASLNKDKRRQTCLSKDQKETLEGIGETPRPKSYQVPSDKPRKASLNEDKHRQTCLNKDQKAALKGIGETPGPKQCTLTQDQIKLIGALQLIDFLRNRASHRMEPLKNWIVANKKPYKAQGSELVTYVRFPMIVPHLQLQLYMRTSIAKFPYERSF